MIDSSAAIHGSHILFGRGGQGGAGGAGGGAANPGWDGGSGYVYRVYNWGTPQVAAASGASKSSACDITPCLVSGTPGDGNLPRHVALLENVPNPFNPKTVIQFALPAAGRVDIWIYDLKGRRVRSLVSDELYPAGRNTTAWDGRGQRGQMLASGSYLVRLRTGDEVHMRKIMLMR